MRIFRILGKSVKDAFKSVFRNLSLSIASISCITITLIIVAIAIVGTFNINSITKNIEGVLEIVTFVDPSASEEEINNIKTSIEEIKYVDKKALKYNSKEDLKNQMSEQDPEMKKIFDNLEENPLSASFVITVTDPSKISEVANKVKEIEKITEVKYGESLVNKLLNTFKIIRNACIIAVGALILVSAFLIGNTIKITIFSRRQEIGIMRLVGTSNIVIKLPYLVEGFIIGIVGSIIPIVLTIYGYDFLYNYVGGTLFTNLVVLVKPAEIVYQASLVLLIFGGLVGMFGSISAVRRYLKV